MKNSINRLATLTGTIALFFAGVFINTACVFRGHQPSLPANANKMRKYDK